MLSINIFLVIPVFSENIFFGNTSFIPKKKIADKKMIKKD